MKKEISKLNFSGNLVIDNIEKIKKKIKKKILNTEISLIHFDNVSQIDLSGIQILEALRKTMLKSGNICKIKLDIVPEYESILQRTGFKYFIDQISLNTKDNEAKLEVDN